MGGAAKTVKRATLAGVTGGLSEFGQSNPFGVNAVQNPLNPLANKLAPGLFPGQGGGQYTSGPFSIDPLQVKADQDAINALGSQQREATDAYSLTDQAKRSAGRDALAAALTKQSQEYFKQALPETEETLNAQHLLNGSGLGQEIARQQGNLAANIANQVGVQGANDMNRASDLSLMGLQQQQGAQTNALSRGFSLNDFINQANVAKAIGAQAAPQVGNGKGQTGTLLSGIGATAPLISAVKGAGKGAAVGGPPGAVAGAVLPTLAGGFGPVG